MVKYSWSLDRLIEQHGFRPIKLWKNTKYEAGKTYWCSYWQRYYRVLDVQYDERGYLDYVEVEWQDGRIGRHCTSLEYRSDFELKWPEGKGFVIHAEEPEPATVYDPDDDDLLDDFEEFDDDLLTQDDMDFELVEAICGQF